MNWEEIEQAGIPLQGGISGNAEVETDVQRQNHMEPQRKQNIANSRLPDVGAVTVAPSGESTRLNRAPEGAIRPLRQDDVESIAQLYERIMPKSQHLTRESLRTHLSRILLQHPWRNDSLPSLVYEERDGRVAGCLGIVPRPMLFQNQPFTAAVGHSYIVDPGSRSAMAALKLAKTFLAGPQDLSMAEGNDMSRRVWEMAGGSVTLLYSLCWTKPLKPGRYVMSYLRRRELPRAVKWALSLPCRLADAFAPLAGRPFRFRAPLATADSVLDAETLYESFLHLTKSRPVRPDYDENALRWMLATLAEKQNRGTFHNVSVLNERGETIGWYMYYGQAGEPGAVVQVAARQGDGDQVLDHLFHHANRRGIIALSGQVDPTLFHVLARKDCLFHHDGGSWFMLHSRRPEILQAIHCGDAFLSRLEGEWWISFLLS